MRDGPRRPLLKWRRRTVPPWTKLEARLRLRQLPHRQGRACRRSEIPHLRARLEGRTVWQIGPCTESGFAPSPAHRARADHRPCALCCDEDPAVASTAAAATAAAAIIVADVAEALLAAAVPGPANGIGVIRDSNRQAGKNLGDGVVEALLFAAGAELLR